MVNAVVLAGGKQKFGHYKSKAAVELNGKRCIDYVVDALEDSRNIDNILIVGDKYNLGKEIKGHKVIQERKGFFQNAITGYDHFELIIEDKEPLFYVFSDIPFVTSTAIDGFLEKCNNSANSNGDADLSLCLVDIDQINKFFPGCKKNYPSMRVKDFSFRMGNCGLIYPGRILDTEFERKYHIFENAYHARRFDQFSSFVKFIWNAGPIFIYDLLPKNFSKREFYSSLLKNEFYFDVTTKNFEELFLKKTGLRFRFIKTYYPELAVDIDTLKDKEYIENYFRFRN